MISVERALDCIREKSVEEIREFARNRVLGIDIGSFGSGHSTEPSEDVVIQLLRNAELESEKRKAVVEGWMDVYLKVREWLDSVDYVEDIKDWKDIVVNLCRVCDIAEPSEFKKYVKRLITELLDEECCAKELLGAAVKAYMAYAQDEKSVRFWEEEILTNKYVAAYGFNALLDIDAGHSRIEEKLCDLWRLQVEENWPVNTAFLLRRAARVRNETALIYRVLLKLKNKDYFLWKKIEKELNQPWSQQWLGKLVEFESPSHQGVYKKTYESEIIGKHKRYNSEMELVKIEDASTYFDGRPHIKATIYTDISNMGQYSRLKRIVEDPSYTTRVRLEHSPKSHKETGYVSKVG